LFSQIKSARKTGGDVKEKRKSEDVRKSETLQEEEKIKVKEYMILLNRGCKWDNIFFPRIDRLHSQNYHI
jgi:hypothetical protein